MWLILRCRKCSKFCGRARPLAEIEIKCPRCKAMNVWVLGVEPNGRKPHEPLRAKRPFELAGLEEPR
jgi:phage FluMu protein Com